MDNNTKLSKKVERLNKYHESKLLQDSQYFIFKIQCASIEEYNGINIEQEVENIVLDNYDKLSQIQEIYKKQNQAYSKYIAEYRNLKDKFYNVDDTKTGLFTFNEPPCLIVKVVYNSLIKEKKYEYPEFLKLLDKAKFKIYKNKYDNEDYQLKDYIYKNGRKYQRTYGYKQGLCFCDNFDKFELGDSISFKQDKYNKYDSETIVAYVNNNKIGLMFKGTCRDILNRAIQINNFEVDAFVIYKNQQEKKISFLIGFYSEI